MKFTKMHGIGNDYVYVNCFKEKITAPEKVAKYVSNRHFGVGSDGLILIKPSKIADFQMDMYNADGSRGEMCGNGIRCVAKYVYEYGLTDKTNISVETLAGTKHLEITLQDGKVALVRVNMGAPRLEAEEIPVITEGEQAIQIPIKIKETNYQMTCVSMGNPHCVVFMEEDVNKLNLESIGPEFENHPCFPKRINTEFVNIINTHILRMRVWERGSGETLACGTGACATAVAAILGGFTKNKVTIQLLGGDLEIQWDGGNTPVYMTGPATIVFDGELQLPREWKEKE
ncbi:MAG: diaminopimelate epimerase [Lachnospiraceae bacterium]